jgi:type IV secretory pathway VirB2 component (pilin)
MSGAAGSRTARDLAILLGAFAVASALAGVFGAANFGTALAFGQIGFAVALVWVLLRR